MSDQIMLLAHDRNRILETYIKSLNFELHNEMNNREKCNWLKIQAAFFSLLAAVADTGTETDASYYPIRAGIAALENEWNQNRKIEEYANMCGVSKAYFYRCFKEWQKESPIAFRNRIRLSNAESMLCFTDMKIKEISEAVGFDDPFYFDRIFVRQYGVSPRKYRELKRRKPGSQ